MGTHAHILRDAKLAAAKVNAEVDESASKQTYRHTYHIKRHVHPTHISTPLPISPLSAREEVEQLIAHSSLTNSRLRSGRSDVPHGRALLAPLLLPR